jgi:CBS domain-containing protein
MSQFPPPTVREVMSTEVVSISADAAFQDAAIIMERHHISGLPVVNDDGTLVGVVSQTDLVRSRATEHLWQRWPGLAVRHLMTSPAITIHETATVEEAAALMERHRIHRLVVVSSSDETRPLGVLSTTDLIRTIARGMSDGTA